MHFDEAHESVYSPSFVVTLELLARIISGFPGTTIGQDAMKKKMPKAVALAVGLATLFTLGQAPAQADTESTSAPGFVLRFDTGWD